MSRAAYLHPANSLRAGSASVQPNQSNAAEEHVYMRLVAMNV